jgi:hypothetical protein
LVNDRQRAWLLIALVAVLCGAAIWGVSYYRRSQVQTPAALLRRLPTQDAVLLYVDFAELRRGGILGLLMGSQVAQEPEYRVFVEKTQFDYQEDLDAALVSFAPAGKFFLVRGRFDWGRLRAYAREQDGQCYNVFCQMSGSTRDRKISFFPLHRSVMALAVGPDESAARRLQQPPGSAPAFDVPPEPIWLAVPGKALAGDTPLPEGTRMFARSLSKAESITVALGPQGERFRATLRVRCRSAQDAAALVEQLQVTTTLLRSLISREGQKPNPRDLSGVLTGGSFRQDGAQVEGHWPIERALITDLLSGAS